MKYVQISFHFEHTDEIETILDRHGIRHFVRYPMIEGRDSDGKHYGTQVHPGNVTVVQAQVEDAAMEKLMDDLRTYRQARRSHEHLEAIVLPIEQRLSDEPANVHHRTDRGKSPVARS